MNKILLADSYFYSHHKQFPPRTQIARCYLEPRGGPYSHVLTFGALQVALDELFGEPISQADVVEADELVAEHMGPNIFNRKGWDYILNKHGGYMPLSIRAVPEGLLVPTQNVILTSENTDPEVPWLPNHFESALYPWYPYTVATLSHACRQIILRHLTLSGDPSLIDYKLHDFGFRGTTDQFVGWQAMVGGLAHLVNFKGTDNVPALFGARKYYGCKMAGHSVPAAEHATITSWGRQSEAAAYRNMLQQFPTGLVAVVSDSYDIYEACEKLWGELLRDEVLARDGVLVVRPDSGTPHEVVLKCLEILGAKFGYSVNSLGYKVLYPKVRIIQGDGVDEQSIDMVLAVAEIHGWSADNITFGMGGALLQRCTRDTMRWAFKCCEVVVDGQPRDVQKSPVGDSGKKSKAGNLTLAVNRRDGSYSTMRREALNGNAEWADILVPAYLNGQILLHDSLDTIRQRLIHL